MPFVGERIAAKIEEIAFSGDLLRLKATDKEKKAVIEMFKNIHGVGDIVAPQFYAQVRQCGCNDWFIIMTLASKR